MPESKTGGGLGEECKGCNIYCWLTGRPKWFGIDIE
jgi:hypothetical protein